MDYFTRYLVTVIPINILEISAAIAGSYFLYKKPNTLIINKYLVYFLWLTVFVEILGKYASVAYFTNFEYFGFIKDTVLKNNYWLYNIYLIGFFGFFAYYFKSFFTSKKERNYLNSLTVLYMLLSILYLFFTDVFFNSYSVFTVVVGSLLVLLSVVLFYFRLLKTDKIINLKRYLPIYVSAGILVFSLCMAPLDIFSQYFNRANELYVKLSSLILLIANIFMYGTFIIGFLACAKSNSKKNETTNFN